MRIICSRYRKYPFGSRFNVLDDFAYTLASFFFLEARTFFATLTVSVSGIFLVLADLLYFIPFYSTRMVDMQVGESESAVKIPDGAAGSHAVDVNVV